MLSVVYVEEHLSTSELVQKDPEPCLSLTASQAESLLVAATEMVPFFFPFRARITPCSPG